MRVKSMLTVGFLSMMAATAVVNASDSFAAAQRVDVINRLDETVAQLDSATIKSMRVDVIDRIGSGGALYAYPKSMRVDVIDSIQDRGSQYAYTKPMSH
ncbi:MAG: hypothetical protein EWM72_01066 [Nitrospira sp.]|nr:MAG: hypothetical protein EWM72_01066 [Nitrospira sp.]